jgi:hypothetical protein
MFCSLKQAFNDFWNKISLHCLKLPLHDNVIPKYLYDFMHSIVWSLYNRLLFNNLPDLLQKSLKACFKLQKCLFSASPSVSTYLHLYDHTIKPILLYGSEIWGMFDTNSAKINSETPFITKWTWMHSFPLIFLCYGFNTRM